MVQLMLNAVQVSKSKAMMKGSSVLLQTQEPTILNITPAANRLTGYDLARGMAVYGMMVINFCCVFSQYDFSPCWLYSLIEKIEGRAAALFVMLAGIGISLLTRKARINPSPESIGKARKTLLKRSVFLYFAGLLLSFTWPGDILHYYGLYLVIAAFGFTASDKALITGAITAPFIFLGFLIFSNTGKIFLVYFPTWNTLEDFYGLFKNSFFNGPYPVFPWITFIFAGMWIGRQDLTDSRLRKHLFIAGILMAASGEFASRMVYRDFSTGSLSTILNQTAILPTSHSLIRLCSGTSMSPPTPFFIVSAGGTAICLLAISLFLTDRINYKWIKPFADVGRMALTAYVSHVVFGINLLLYSGYSDEETVMFSLGWATAYYVLFLFFCFLWLKRYSTGPIEYLMRRFLVSSANQFIPPGILAHEKPVR